VSSKTDDKYTDPELHNVVKEEIQASNKGGAPGQWSARKAQMMATEHRKRGGEYTTDKKDGSAKHLDQWTEEEWQTKEGSGNARDASGLEHRYLPTKAWEQMSDKEKEETDAKKHEGSKEGKQNVANTPKAADAKKNAGKDSNGFEKIEKKSTTDCTTQWDDPEHMENNQREYKKFMEDNRKSKSTSPDDRPGKKRGQGANADLPSASKKHKGTSGINDEPMAPTGDKTRVPQKGHKVQWHSGSGYVTGEVVEVLYEDKEVNGEKVEASKEDPRVMLKTDSTGKVCVHKPEAVYFD